jgi:hypothetical protein
MAGNGPTAEQQRAVEAFAGEWLYHSTTTAPDAHPVRADVAMNCTKTAGGKAVMCTFSGEIPGSGPLQAGVLVGADRLDHKVHFMAMTSDDELHDHVCTWQDAKSLACEPLHGGLGGQPITEDLQFAFEGQSSSFRSVIHTADGKQFVFEAQGAKVTTPPPGATVSKPAEPSADQKKLVTAFLGTWTWDANIAFPDGTHAGAQLGLQCQATAGGKAAACTLAAKELAGRPYEAAILIGHDPYDKEVHFMMMSSDDELWYRPCAWKTDTMLACGPKRTGVFGTPVTSELTFDFAGAAGSTRWLTDLGDGKTCSLSARMSK